MNSLYEYNDSIIYYNIITVYSPSYVVQDTDLRPSGRKIKYYNLVKVEYMELLCWSVLDCVEVPNKRTSECKNTLNGSML